MKRLKKTFSAQRKRCWTKGLALTLAAALLIPSSGFALINDEVPAGDGSCAHHPQHTTECGYGEAVEGTPCTHDHDESCGYGEAAEGKDTTKKTTAKKTTAKKTTAKKTTKTAAGKKPAAKK